MPGNLRTFLCKSFSKYSRPHTSITASSFHRQIPRTPPNAITLDAVLIPKSQAPDSKSPISKSHHLLHPNCRNLREFSSESNDVAFDQSKEIDEINLKFAEAREEIEMAMESKETVYFDEEAEAAREAVKTVLEKFKSLSAKLPEEERAALQRSMGLKIEQLKAELQQLND
ncbi:hypothetical protein ACLOJK_019822 [Asimina triloba]